MIKFIAWLIIQVGLVLACLLNGLLSLWILNPVFHMAVSYWGWVGVAFVLTEIVSSGVQLQKISE